MKSRLSIAPCCRTLIVVVAFVIFSATLAIWIRGHWYADWLTVYWNLHQHEFSTDPLSGSSILRIVHSRGQARLIYSREAVLPMSFRPDVSGRRKWCRYQSERWDEQGLPWPHRRACLGFFYKVEPSLHELWVPDWAIFALSATLPAAFLLRHLSRRPAPPETCPSCAYDLRATPHRCPECGKS